MPSLVFGPIVSVAHPELRITPCAKPTMVAPPWKCPLDLVVPKYVTVLMVAVTLGLAGAIIVVLSR